MACTLVEVVLYRNTRVVQAVTHGGNTATVVAHGVILTRHQKYADVGGQRFEPFSLIGAGGQGHKIAHAADREAIATQGVGTIDLHGLTEGVEPLVAVCSLAATAEAVIITAKGKIFDQIRDVMAALQSFD